MANSRAHTNAKIARIFSASNTYTTDAETNFSANTKINGALTLSNVAKFEADTGYAWSAIKVTNNLDNNECAMRLFSNTNTWAGTLYSVTTGEIGFLNASAGWSLRHFTANNTLSVANTLFNTTTYAAGTTTVAPMKLTAGTSLTTPAAGSVEYDGNHLMFTPSGATRGIVPAHQHYMLTTALARVDQIAAQSILGQGVTVTAGDTYSFEGTFALAKTAGATSGYMNFLFGGSALGTVSYTVETRFGATLTALEPDDQMAYYTGTTIGTPIQCHAASTTAAVATLIKIDGHFTCTTGGTLVPAMSLSAVLGGAYTTQPGSFFRIWPTGNIGTWAAA